MIVALKIQLENGETFWSCYDKSKIFPTSKKESYNLLINSYGAFDDEAVTPLTLELEDPQILQEIILEE